MKNKTIIIALVLLFTVILAACAPTAGVSDTEVKRTVSVNGTGTVTLIPDMAIISIGVQTQNSDAKKAVSQNNEQTEAVMDTFEEFSIPAEDVQSTNFSIYPRQDYDREGNMTEIAYVVQNTMRVTVRDLEILGEILDKVVESGANRVSGIRFDVSDRDSAYVQAMEAAMENAFSRAEILVKAAGAELGEVQLINLSIGGGGVVVAERASDLPPASANVYVPPGEMKIRVDVSVVYEIQ